MLSVCIIRHAVAAGYLLRHSWAKWGQKKQKNNYSTGDLTQKQNKTLKASLLCHDWHPFRGMTIKSQLLPLYKIEAAYFSEKNGSLDKREF